MPPAPAAGSARRVALLLPFSPSSSFLLLLPPVRRHRNTVRCCDTVTCSTDASSDFYRTQRVSDTMTVRLPTSQRVKEFSEFTE